MTGITLNYTFKKINFLPHRKHHQCPLYGPVFLMSFAEKTGVFCGQHPKHVNTLCGPKQNHLPTVTEGSMYTPIPHIFWGCIPKKFPLEMLKSVNNKSAPLSLPPRQHCFRIRSVVLSLHKHSDGSCFHFALTF